jgi:TonB family protein
MMPDPLAPEMEKGDRFWVTFCVVLLVHAALIGGVVVISKWLFPPRAVETITWLNGGFAPESESTEAPEHSEEKVEPTVEKPPEPEVEKPAESGHLKIALPTPTPTPTPKATPKPSSTPKVATPKPKEKESPKKTVVKTTPKPTPRKTLAAATPTIKPAVPGPQSDSPAQAGTKSGPGAAGGTGTNAFVAEQMKRYGDLIESRFRAIWDQPVTGESNGARNLVGTISFRVGADGSVVSIRVSKSTGNRLVDDSLEAVCNRVKSLPAPPAAILSGGHFQSSIEMVLDR